VPTPEDGRVRPKHGVEEYTQDKYMNKDVTFTTAITLTYRRLMVMQQGAEIQHYTTVTKHLEWAKSLTFLKY
jgi:hypothetical protein